MRRLKASVVREVEEKKEEEEGKKEEKGNRCAKNP